MFENIRKRIKIVYLQMKLSVCKDGLIDIVLDWNKSLQEENGKLKDQIEEMKCCGNCRFSESDTLNGTFCHREGCFVVASAKCKLWEM